MTLSGHSAVVFGGTKGIGAATAELLAERGASVAVVGRHEKEGEAVAARCRQLGAAAIFVEADVSSEPEVAAAVDAAVGAHGPLSMAINSAGIDIPRPLLHLSNDDLQTQLAVNTTGLVWCLRQEIAAMVETGHGSIVNVTSIAGFLPIPSNAVYGATKAADTALTRSAAHDYAAAGIRVNAVAPGTTRTEMLDTWLAEVGAPSGMTLADLEGGVALRKLAAPREQATAIVFLLSDEASFITGATLIVDGGATLLNRVATTPGGLPPETPGEAIARARVPGPPD